MWLTESMAMSPAASVSGFYLAHPEASYFNVGPIGDDQAKAWAETLGVGAEEARRRLRPNWG
jgi:5-methyltetrahydrofolate--homocysteine methyltransferase